ncbi:MAG: hypothetical protein WC131_03715 [Bacilli bacterium]
MKLAKRENNQITELNKISTISGLENSQLIILERGDAMKTAAKGFRTLFGRKDLTSVKSLNEAIAANAIKAAKKAKNGSKYELCCVCTDFVPVSSLDSRGVCRCCQL